MAHGIILHVVHHDEKGVSFCFSFLWGPIRPKRQNQISVDAIMQHETGDGELELRPKKKENARFNYLPLTVIALVMIDRFI